MTPCHRLRAGCGARGTTDDTGIGPQMERRHGHECVLAMRPEDVTWPDGARSTRGGNDLEAVALELSPARTPVAQPLTLCNEPAKHVGEVLNLHAESLTLRRRFGHPATLYPRVRLPLLSPRKRLVGYLIHMGRSMVAARVDT
jgi:hypothetical protein